jgi:hypothetical protein
MQMLAIALSIFLLALTGMFYPYNGVGLISACVVLYALTAGIAGERTCSRCPAHHRPVQPYLCRAFASSAAEHVQNNEQQC